MSDNINNKGGSDQLLNSLKWVVMWVCIAMAVMGCIRVFMGADKAVDFLGGYLIEFSLSIDNLFVFMSIFTSFGLAEHARHKVLHWGIIGAVVLRFIFIMAGVAIVEKFEFVLYFFGVLLIWNGIKMMRGGDAEADEADSICMKAIRKVLPMSERFDGEKFVTEVPDQKSGKLKKVATPLLGVLMLVEFSDIIFAVDSVPAVFSITTDAFIVYTSNILAILGLRQLYFVLEYMANRFGYVKYGVALILMFTGLKLLIVIFGVKVSTPVSIAIILSVLVLSIILSLVLSGKRGQE